MHIGYLWESHKEDQDVGGRIILKWILDMGWSGMDWIHLAKDRDQWRALVNMVMNFRDPSNIGNFLNSCTTGGFSRWSQLHEVS
jgi:hypothetical protein